MRHISLPVSGIIRSCSGRRQTQRQSALAALKEAETEAREAQQELDAKRQELKSVKAGVKAAAARLTEAQERVKTRWVLLVGESVLNAVERQLLDFKGKKRQWFNLLNPVLDTDIKPDESRPLRQLETADAEAGRYRR